MEIYTISSLEKVFPDRKPTSDFVCGCCSFFKNEVFSFQTAVYWEGNGWDAIRNLDINVESDIANLITVRQVKCVPVGVASYGYIDDNYISNRPGLYPDLLESVGTRFRILTGSWNALWFDITPTDKTTAGQYPITIRLAENGETVCETSLTVTIINSELLPQKLINTAWFYADCLSDYYGTPTFSERHWEIVGNFIKNAAARGMNMLLTPVFTPPLETEQGRERKTVQLIDISLVNGVYSFDFSKLERWIFIAKECGIEYFEIAHLFTQWGATHTPKIIVTENGIKSAHFGWHEEASTGSYRRFLEQFIPALLAFLHGIGIDRDHVYFHISDEPDSWCFDTYKQARELVNDLLSGYKIFDALSNPDFFQEKLIDIPVVSTDHYDRFEQFDLAEKWVYYCCGQAVDTSNRFIAMPSARNRILGVQMYLYQIHGFLHWGYNFYNAGKSEREINPYFSTDADGIYPSGDPFIVYPAPNGKPHDSLRHMVFAQALYDLRALQTLESLAGREQVNAMIHDGLSEQITFKRYPKSEQWLLSLRHRVNEAIKNYI